MKIFKIKKLFNSYRNSIRCKNVPPNEINTNLDINQHSYSTLIGDGRKRCLLLGGHTEKKKDINRKILVQKLFDATFRGLFQYIKPNSQDP